MTASALALVIGAAVLHSTWNGLAKGGQDQIAFLWSAVLVSTAILLPFTAAALWREGLPAASLPFVCATSALHAAYFYALGRSYRAGDLSVVYPIARGLGVALVPPLALALFDERLSPLGAAGVGLVVLGILGGHAVRVLAGEAPAAGGPALGWALLTGLTIAAYSLVDKAGVARLHPVPYLGLTEAGTALLLAPAALARRGALRREWAASGRAIVAAGAMSLAAYLLVLFAFRLSKTGYVVAARELSIVFSVLIGRLWLGERQVVPRLAGAGVVLAGVACLAAAR